MRILGLGLIAAVALGLVSQDLSAQLPAPVVVTPEMKTLGSQWDGYEVGFLGDSMSTLCDTAVNKRFYDYLHNLLGITPHVYARSGWQYKNLLGEVDKMKSAHPDVSAVMVWAGTNDYNHSCPIGEFFTESSGEVNANGQTVTRRRRCMVMSDSTFCGRINLLLSKLKETFPDRQIILLTPIHRGFARFRDTNVQPSEEYANALGLYIDDYVRTIREAGDVWSVPVIDLYSLSGLYPAGEFHSIYIQKPDTDRLHPNTLGHFRLARTLQYQLLALPSKF